MVDFSGLKALIEILEWLWCVMADQVNYPAEPLWDTEGDLWPEWEWGLCNAWRSDRMAPWNKPIHSKYR